MTTANTHRPFAAILPTTQLYVGVALGGQSHCWLLFNTTAAERPLSSVGGHPCASLALCSSIIERTPFCYAVGCGVPKGDALWRLAVLRLSNHLLSPPFRFKHGDRDPFREREITSLLIL